MIRRTVRRGPRAGLEMWGCSRWPDCAGVINIDPASSDAAAAEPLPIRSGTPGAHAQWRMERERSTLRVKRRAMLPLVVGTTLIVINVAFLSLLGFGVPVAVAGSSIAAVGMLSALFRLPTELLFWAKGVEGERKAAAFIEPLLEAGYVALFNLDSCRAAATST